MPYKDKEKEKAYQKARYQKGKAKAGVGSEEYRQKNKDRIKEYYQKNKDQVKARSAKYRTEHKEATLARERRHNLLRDFNLTVEGYNELFQKQGGRCAVCGKHQSDFKIALAVDHCHTTGKIRGLLCSSCNRAIGLLGDDLYGVTLAMEYLQDAA